MISLIQQYPVTAVLLSMMFGGTVGLLAAALCAVAAALCAVAASADELAKRSLDSRK